MKRGLGLSHSEIGDVFTKWNTGVLDSFLIEITRDIMKYKDPADETPLVEKILDSAGQKGTGKWTAINALDLGMPVTLIGESVFARCLSSIKGERTRASQVLEGPEIAPFTGNKEEAIADLEQVRFILALGIQANGRIGRHFMLARSSLMPRALCLSARCAPQPFVVLYYGGHWC